ncbi:MAG TPA: hypothetical protein VGD38_02280 [Pyrinomonadaceae bacterium]
MERRLDRIERLLVLFIKAGDRERREWRKQSREQTEMIKMVIDAHIKGSDRIDKMAARADEWLQEQRIAYALRNEQMDKVAARADEWIREQRIAHALRTEEMDKLRIAQDRTDKHVDKLQAGQVALQEGQAKLDQVMAELAEEHKATERSLQALLDGLQKGQNGKPPT